MDDESEAQWIQPWRITGFQTGSGWGAPIGSTHAEDIESLVHLGLMVEGIPTMALFVMTPVEAEIVGNALLDAVKEHEGG